MEENNYTAYQQPLSPNDHTPVKPKKKGKKALIIVIAVVVVLAIAAAIAISSLSSSPLALVAKGAENTLSAMEQGELYQLRSRMEEGGSLEVSVDLAPITRELLGYGMSGTVTGKLYAEPGSLGLTAGAELGGVPLLDASMLLSREELAIASQALLGDDVYGINLEMLHENFDSSVFGPNGDYSLGVTAEEIQTLLDTFDSAEPSQEMEEDAKAIAADFLLVVYNSLQTHGEIGKEKASVTFGGEACDTTAVTIAMDAAGIVEFAADILEYANTDQKLRDFLTTHAHTIASAAAYDSYDDITGEELVNEFYTAVEEALLSLDEAREEARTSHLHAVLTFHITKAGSYLAGLELDISGEGETYTAQCFFGPSPEALKEFRLDFGDDYSEYSVCYTVEASGDAEYSGKLTVNADGAPILGTIHWDKTSGELQTIFAADGVTLDLKGSLKHDKTSTTLTVDSVHTNSEELLSDLGLALTLTPGDKMAPMGEYTDLLTMSSSEVESLVYQLYGAAMQLFGVLG